MTPNDSTNRSEREQGQRLVPDKLATDVIDISLSMKISDSPGRREVRINIENSYACSASYS